MAGTPQHNPRQASWHAVVRSGSPGVDSGSASGKPAKGSAAASPDKFPVPVFAKKALMLQWMDLFDKFNHSPKPPHGVNIHGKLIPANIFVRDYIHVIAHEIALATPMVAKMNRSSFDEGQSLSNWDEIRVKIAASASLIGRSEAALASGKNYRGAYQALLDGMGAAWQARAAVSSGQQKNIENLDHWVTGLELVRDGGFAAVGLLAAPAGASLVIAFEISAGGVLITAADDWAGGGKTLAQISFELIIGLVGGKLAGVAKPAIERTLVRWLERSGGAVLLKATNTVFFQKFGVWLQTRGDTAVVAKFEAMLGRQKLGESEIKALMSHASAFMLEKNLARHMADHLLDAGKDLLKNMTAEIYRQVMAYPDMTTEERCHKFVEGLELGKWATTGTAKSVIVDLIEVASRKLH